MNRIVFTLPLAFIIWFAALADSEKIAELEKKLAETTDTVRVNILLDLATEYEYSDRNKAADYANQANDLSHELNYTKGIIRSQYELAIISFINGDRADALPYLEKGLKMSLEINEDIFIASGYFNLSHYYEEEGAYIKALDYLNQSLNIYKSRNQVKRISQCYSSLGGIYKSLGQYEEAVNYYFDALSIKDSINDQRGKSIVLSNIGGVYLLTSKLEEALDYFSQCLIIDRKNEDKEGIVYTLTRIGVAYQKMDKNELALSYYDTALVLSRELNFRIDESIILGNIGSTLRSLEKYQESLSYLFSALKIKEELFRFGSAAHTCNDICETYLKMGDYVEAKKYAIRAISFAANVDVNQHRVGLYLLSECEYELNDFKNAYDHLVQANVIKDSLFTAESEAKMNELEVKYQSDKGKQEIENLTALNETARYRNISYAGAAISFLILGGLLYYVQRLRTRRNRLLLEKEKELDRIKSRFFANISHEFRTPLTLILSPIDDLIAKIEQTSVRKQLKVMKRNASRLLDLVNQLLDLSKIESGKLKLNISHSDIISVVRGVSMSFHSIAEQKNIEIELDVTPAQLSINYDRAKIETVLTNLLSNAFKFAPENSKVIIEVVIAPNTSDSTNKEYIHITVSDEGPGIAQEDIDHIFNRFYQSDNNRLLQQEGSGIGLALTKELVELHGGSIYAKSDLGKGTQITICLPLDLPLSDSKEEGSVIMQEEKALNAHEEEAEDFSEEVTDNQLPVVLVVEDNKDVRDYISETLKKDYNVQLAVDGAAGIEKATTQIPDLIISDVMMPLKDGYEVCRALKHDERTSHIPIILLTAKSDSEDKIEGLKTAADDYVTKPFVPKELLARIQNLINSRKHLLEKYKSDGVLKPKDITTNSIDENFLTRIVELVEENIGNEKYGVEQLGNEIGMSRSQLHRKMKALVDQGPNQFIRSFRLQRAYDLLKQNAATSSEIAYQVGFSSPSYFTKCFHEQFGHTPSEIPG